jgi:hypothetical protein
MWQRRLKSHEREKAEGIIETVGRWLRNGEPAQSVAEDLLGHEIRSCLVKLRHAVTRGRADDVERLTLAVEACMMELYKQRSRRMR